MGSAAPRDLAAGVGPSVPRRPAAWIALLGLALLAGGLRLAVLERVFPTELLGDEVYYAEVGARLGRGEGHSYPEASGTTVRAFRPPAQAFLLSLALRGVGSPVPADRLHAALLLQVALSTLLVIATVLLGRELFDDRVGLLAGALAAVYPNFVAHAHYLWAETLFATLVTAALWLVVANRSRHRAWLAAAAGATFGFAALTREAAIPVALVAAVWSVASLPRDARRAAARQGALMLACAALVVLPWTLRNHRVLGRWVPVATVGWFAAGEGNALEPEWLRAHGPHRQEFKLAYLRTRGELERTDFARARTLEMIREEQPGWIFKKLVRNTRLLFAPDATLFYKLRAGGYGDAPRSVVVPVLAAHLLLYTLIVVGGVLGAVQARGAGRRSLVGAVFAAVVALHVLANATARFRMPWMPLLMVYASHFALRWRTLRWRPGSPATWLGALLLLYFLAVCLPAFPGAAPALE